MSQCSKCKKIFDEINLTFVYENNKLILVCAECKKNLDEKKEAWYKRISLCEEIGKNQPLINS